ncbi:hypothetical protein [Spirosoma sp. KUDC1026]|uniref:hypothetical protein n=1 Tax=Spirosoma sp. KUDC1026 TaxID=2745947 RepID=UPI001E5DDEF7|nr:hypothetical protein [Spirosoma sp. KUDC1026]
MSGTLFGWTSTAAPLKPLLAALAGNVIIADAFLEAIIENIFSSAFPDLDFILNSDLGLFSGAGYRPIPLTSTISFLAIDSKT